jgi:uncharacterized lipoprotein YddW (UPF0748 family)
MQNGIEWFETETGIGFFAAGPDTPERVSWLYRHHRDDWHVWKRGRITELVRRLSAVVRGRRRRLSAAVFDCIPWARQEVAQDWSVWCNERLLDFVCPMDYGMKPDKLAERLDEQNSFLKEPRIPALSGILTGCGIIELTREELSECETVARSRGREGVCLYSYGTWRAVLL